MVNPKPRPKPRKGRPWARLPESIREKVIERFRSHLYEDNWFDNVYSESTSILHYLGYEEIEINFSGFSSQGDGARFTGLWLANFCKITHVRENYGNDALKPILDRFAVLLVTAKITGQEIPSFQITAGGHYYHEHTTHFDFTWERDEDVAAPLYEHEVETELMDLSRDLMRMIYHQLEADHDYQSSTETIVESIEANDYHFDSEGRII